MRWVYRHFPLRSLHAKAAKEAEATECAAELGGNEKFWQYLDLLFATTPSNDGLDLAELPRIATQVGLNEQKFTSCLASGKYAQKVSEQEQDAVAAGGRGTPYSILVTQDGTTIPIEGAVPLGQVTQIIDAIIR